MAHIDSLKTAATEAFTQGAQDASEVDAVTTYFYRRGRNATRKALGADLPRDAEGIAAFLASVRG